MRQLSFDEIRNIQLKILCDVASFCKQKNITYYLCGGTLLGAVRHHGFIPWDDDIDIEMPRTDYNTFIKEFDGKGLYKVISIENDPHYYLAAAKVIDTNTTLVESIDINSSIGVYIDVFPIDSIPDSIIKSKKLLYSIAVRRWILQSKTISVRKERSALKNIVLRSLKKMSANISYRDLAESINRISQSYSRDNSTKRVGVISTMIYGNREIMDRSWFQGYAELEFENRLFHSPVGYHYILEQMYGDYMKLPPLSQQKSHHKNEAYILEEK